MEFLFEVQVILTHKNIKSNSTFRRNDHEMRIFFHAISCLFVLILYFGASASLEPQREIPLKKLAFGSCNKQRLEQTVWDGILSYNPDLWVWLGDVVYVDIMLLPGYFFPRSLTYIKGEYDYQKNHPKYKQLIEKIPTIGVWDDHDYGLNNAGGEVKFKADTQKIFLDFIDEPKESPRWDRKGIWGSYNYGPAGKRVKVILLDVRYWRDPLGDTKGDILGPDQWVWLEEELKNSDAQINLIASGTQVLPWDKPLQEKWSHYPIARQKLFDLINQYKVPGVIFLSGDVHYAEMLKSDLISTYPIWEATSSGMTHTCQTQSRGLCGWYLHRFATSTYHVSEFFYDFNFGTIDFHWDAPEPRLDISIRNENGTAVVVTEIPISSLQPTDKKIEGENIPKGYLEAPTGEFYVRITALVLCFVAVALPSYCIWRCCCRQKNHQVRTEHSSTKRKIKKED
eukprot:TRINITY_DN3641_c0_g1_i1.p1 TRINITY_DN3641_c0_g1~~TRINITY_DN3641_c0_g1_i1.p1  ORF type:complete len:454 (-),score=134.57 TRINITY_DN3641_c0_g1_i1:153-1514(-)